MAREHYDFAFTLLPAADTHGHHQAATLIALDAAARGPEDAVRPYAPLPGHPETAPWPGAPVFRFNRLAHFGFHDSLTYQIVVNWMIAEHKSQGLFQTECNRLDEERFWLLARSAPDALERTQALFNLIRPPAAGK